MILVEMQEIKDAFLSQDIRPELYSSLIVMGIIIILAIIIGIKAKLQDPLKKPKGLLLVAEIGVNFFDGMANDLMGPNFKGFGGYFMAIAAYLFLSFIFGLTGLPSPVTYIAIPLSLGLSTFILIHATSIKYTKWKYFKRYVDPLPIFLPINLVTAWAPVLSLTLRLFGNAVAGWTIMSLLYTALQELSAKIFSFMPIINGNNWNEIFIAPIVTWVLHLYFDLFSALIQTVVFMSLSMIFIGQEGPEDL